MKGLVEKIGGYVMPDNGLLGFILEIAWLILDFVACFVLFGNTINEIIVNGNSFGANGFKFFQIMLFIMLLIIPFYLLRDNKLSGGNMTFGGTGSGKKYGDQGSAKRATASEVRSLSGNDGLVISKNFRLSASKSYEHVAVIGPTGSGKSSSFYIPNLLELDGETSAVVTDPKKEMYNICGPYLRSIGYRTICLTPAEENPKYNYNPLMVASDADELSSLAQLLLSNGGKSVEMATGSSSGGAEWISMSVPLLAAAFIFARYGDPTTTDFVDKESRIKKTVSIAYDRTIYEAIAFILNADLATMDKVFSTNSAAYDKFLLFKTSAGSEKTMSSIKTTLASNVQLFTREKIKAFTRTPYITDEDGTKMINKKKLFTPKMLRKQPTVLFICCPETASIDHMPLMAVVYSQILEKCMSTDGRPVYFLLDEFANIGVIPTIASIAATARSRKIGLAIGIQGMEQLRENYGKDKADNLLNNLKTKMVFAGLSGESADYISKLAGTTTIESQNISRNSGNGNPQDLFGSKSITKSAVKRELFTPDEIRRIDENQVLIIAHNKNPYLDAKNSYFLQKKYKDKLESAEDE